MIVINAESMQLLLAIIGFTLPTYRMSMSYIGSQNLLYLLLYLLMRHCP